ncbi:MAG TPA: alkaline phosphatase family protein [Solirubrobacteraceae bacterium]|nr:alkaline phosphatase family protein [Solirubrobacteraceae bacterium]
MRGRLRKGAFAAVATGALAIGIPVTAAAGHDRHHGGGGHGRHQHAIKHVLLISVDGLHQSDLNWYVANHPGSELAKLTAGGGEYASAQTPVPSDSDPGMTAQMTGGNPKTTGVFYDVEYNHALLPPGTTSCHGQPTGANVIYDSPDDINVNALDAGQGLSGLPGSILNMTSTPQDLLVPSTFPVDPSTCKPISPSQYLKVNTIFNVAHDAGMLTAWSDKHPVYTSFNGPEGNGITDSFDPEIDSIALKPDGTPYPGNIAWTGDNAATMQYDSYKVQAVLNWIDGYNHSRTQKVGVPAILGMNFQTVSTAEKLPTSDGLAGGDLPGTNTPGPLLQRGLQYINDQLQTMEQEIQSQGLADSTAIVLSAKHGQSPQDPSQLTRIDDGPIMDGVNTAWAATHPGAPPLIAAGTDDDAVMWWLSDQSQQAARFAKHYLWTHTATGNTASGGSRTLPHSGLVKIYAGTAAARYFGVLASDPRHPNLWGVVQVGVVYTGGTGKIAEHGGSNPADRDVPLVVYAPGAVDRGVFRDPVETTQIAPTILKLLGLDPDQLQAVQIEGTRVLPGIGR